MNDAERLADQTIADFGRQWGRYADNEGYYGSLELFRDVFAPLLTPAEVAGRRVADIGSGTGRIVNMLLAAGADHVTAVEPAPAAFQALLANTRGHAERVTCLETTGDRLPADAGLDLVVSVGVLHHVPQPDPIVRAAYRALRPGGRFAVWLYGQEGNALYLSLVQPLRRVTRRLPPSVLAGLSWGLTLPAAGYARACRTLPLPLSGYMREVFGAFPLRKQMLVVYDQLNPAYARYYARHEALALLRRGGFVDLAIHHRHGYSWSVVGTRPSG